MVSYRSAVALPNATMALVLLAASEGKIPRSISGMSKKILEIKQQCPGVADRIYLERNAYGYYSSSLDQYIGAFLISGEAIQRDPIELEQSGREFCMEVIQWGCIKYPREMERVADVLNMDIKQYCQKNT